MALDAAKNNRAKETYALTVDYGTIYKSNNEVEIRKLMALECLVIDMLETFSTDKRKSLVNQINKFTNFTDRELAEQRNNRSEVLKNMFKPIYEVINYNIADDNSVGCMIMNNKIKKTENIIISIPEGETLSSFVDTLINMLNELNSQKDKKNPKAASKYRKEIEILGQVEAKERETQH